MASTPVTLTKDLSKAARRELGLSQNDVIKAVGIQAYKLKQWEGRGLPIELVDMRKLSDFYIAQGINLDALREHIGDKVPAPSSRPRKLPDGFTDNPRPGFAVSDQLSPDLIDKLMDQIDANNDLIVELAAATFKAGFFGGITDETEKIARQLIEAMTENYLLYRFLQGRSIVAPASDEPKTLDEYLGTMLKESPAYPLLVGDEERGLKGSSPSKPVAAAKRPITAPPVLAQAEPAGIEG